MKERGIKERAGTSFQKRRPPGLGDVEETEIAECSSQYVACEGADCVQHIASYDTLLAKQSSVSCKTKAQNQS